MNKAILYCVFFLVLLFSGNAQIVPPYIQTFDSATCTGWSHGPVTVGSGDNWQRGVSFKPVLNFASSPPNVWATNLTGVASNYSIMYLQTPSFDLSNLTKVYLLNFAHIYYTFSYHGGNIESSIDNGVTWQLLNTPTLCINWYNNSSCSGLSGQPSWSGSNYTSFMYSTYRLSAFQGQPNVKFRFQYGGLSNSLDGWVIDDFSIVEDIPNVIANRGATCEATKFFSTYTITSTLTYNGFLPGSFSNTTNYYFSTDSILTVSDPFIGSKSQNINSSVSAWTQTFTMVPNLKAGNYYIFYNHDANNNLTELNENDNTNYTILRIDSTFGVPDLNEDFEGTTNYWAPTLVYPSYWKKGLSNIHQAEGAHSGINSWFIDNMKAAPPSSSGGPQYFVSPYFDNSSANNNVICFWYRSKNSYPSAPSKLQLELSGTNSNPVYTSTIAIPMPRFNDWDCNCQSLSALNGQNNAKIRFTYNDMATYSLFNQNMNVDDIYMGQPKPDLSIEHKHILSTPSALTSDTMYYELFNGGAVTAGTSTTEFYWSNDSLLDLSDILLTSVSENTIVPLGYLKEKFLYTKPTTAQGVYFIIYKVDKNSVISEIWENNNIGYYKIRQDGLVSLPYFNDFETQSMGWWHYASIGKDNWQRSAPSGTILTSAFSGSFAFNTTQFPKLSAMSRMHLYTPIFDLTTISNPVMEFDMKLDSDGSCTCFEGKTNMSYSTDGGYTWIVLDTVSSSGNKWYLPMYFDDISGADRMTSAANFTQLLFAGSEPAFTTFQQYNSRDIDENTRYIIDISSLTGKPHVQFRFNTGVAMNDTTVIKNTEGAVIDNFRIRNKFTDLGVNYKKFLMMSGQDQTVKFDMFIKNNGNYISSGFANKFYLSVDTALDLSDFYLGKDSVFYLKPDRKSYRNESFLGPSNLSSYKYLLYQIDANNNVIESNKTNNIGYWPLALDSIASYPYLENFND
ncbi:MAG: CARDB domain-containing protein, partial [Bacteroidia bacterium]